MLLNRRFAIVTNVDRSIHNTFHMATHVGDGANKHRVASQACDSDVQSGVDFDESFITQAVVRYIFGSRQAFKVVEQF